MSVEATLGSDMARAVGAGALPAWAPARGGEPDALTPSGQAPGAGALRLPGIFIMLSGNSAGEGSACVIQGTRVPGGGHGGALRTHIGELLCSTP